MKRSLGIAAVLTALLLTVPPSQASAANDPRPVPLRGGVATNDSYGDPNVAPACPTGSAWRYFASGSSTFSHLGAVHYEMTHCTAFTEVVNGTPMAGSFGSGSITLTAANGDQLWLSQWGTWHLELTASGPLSIVDMQWIAVGGTGRFAHATGSGTAEAVGDIVANTTTGTFTGTIAYRAADRRN